MLELRLWNRVETEEHYIELYENLPVNLQYQFADIQDVNKTVGNYSQTFRVPATKKNLDFFGGVIDPDVRETNSLINNNYNLKRKIRAQLSYQTIPLMNGTVQLKKIYRQKKDFYDLELVFFGETVDLAASIGQDLLTDLSLSSLNYTLNTLNIIGGMFEYLAFPLDGTIKHGIIDRGQNWQNAFLQQAASPFNTDYVLEQSELTPMLNVKYLFNLILTTAGYTYDTSGTPFLDTADFNKLYMPLANGSAITLGDDEEDNSCNVGIEAVNSTTSTSYITVLFLDTVTYGSDPGSNFDNSTGKWTAPSNMFINLRVGVHGTDNVRVQLIRHVSSSSTDVVLWEVGFNYPYNQYNFDPTAPYFVASGDEIYLQFKSDNGGLCYIQPASSAVQGTYLNIFNTSEPVSGFDVDIALNMPKFKQIDFLVGIQKMFNLVFIPDKLDPKKLSIEPFKTYLESGDTKDWTNKIDFSKDLVIIPTTDIQKSSYEFTHQKGKDFVNEAIFNQLGRVFGAKQILDTENDYARGKQDIKSLFAPFVMSVIPNNGLGTHRMINPQGAPITDPIPRICFNTGITSTGFPEGMELMTDAGVPSWYGVFDTFSNYGSTMPTVISQDLNFGAEIPLIPHVAHPLNNLYYKYYSGYINELYSSSARMLECSLFLTPEDIHSFKWNDKIYIENTYYRVIKISGYDATLEAPCRVTLLKILEPIADCVDIPYAALTNGVILFNGSATDYGSQVCCERYGYVWTPDKAGGNSRCRALGTTFTPNVVQ